MSEPRTPLTTAQRRARGLQIACRVSGLTAVVLGGWCLWLAFSTANKPAQMQALDEWRDDAAGDSDELPLVLRPTPKQSGPSAVITQVSAANDVDEESSNVEQAAYVSLRGSPNDPSYLPGITPASGEVEAISDDEQPTVNAAWLTGDIEDSAADDGPEARAAANVPAWKRTTKSPKSELRTPPSIPRR